MVHSVRVALATLAVACCDGGFTVLAKCIHYSPLFLCFSFAVAIKSKVIYAKAAIISSPNRLIGSPLVCCLVYHAALGLVQALAAASSIR